MSGRASTLLGNDVVDLRDPRCRGKSEDRRFVERICARAEAASIRASPDPDRRLWLLWAAKEAGYKAISKLLGAPPPFEHAAFQVHADEPDHGASPSVRGRVAYRGTGVPFRADVAPDRIHVLAWYAPSDRPPLPIHRTVRLLPEGDAGPGGEWRTVLRDRFTKDEWRSVHNPASALVRLKARAEVARTVGVDEGTVEIVCAPGPVGRMPPKVRIEGRPYRGDITLSHHGRLLAWAFTAP